MMPTVRGAVALPMLGYLLQAIVLAGFSDSMVVLGAGFILGQGVAIWGLLRVIKTFGAYAATNAATQQEWTLALRQAHESNQAINASNLLILKKLQALTLKKGAA